LEFAPQQYKVPETLIAQVCHEPVETALTPTHREPSPFTSRVPSGHLQSGGAPARFEQEAFGESEQPPLSMAHASATPQSTA
jgi:hypothetical protein